MFSRLLIANRGEIACRIARSAQALGIHCIALYTLEDAASLHVSQCDEAWRIDSTEGYLDIAAILEIAQKTDAQAVHPGYGFLSENAAFAEACISAGLVFIGPSAAAIRAMGSKTTAKTLMEQAGVPVIPGYYGETQDDEQLLAQAGKVGYPLLVKASAGGGGRGMRVVESAAELPEAISACRREAAKYFADDRLMLERYLGGSRHIELQIFADAHGQIMHLFERDCSLQRRHQKVIEEAPAAQLSEDLRERMGQAAIEAARAVDYCGAGTVEFLLNEDGQFFFMEMNTRLQVEHPVTEMICGVDLVEWQLRIASGEPLLQLQVDKKGHAIEVRICAEDCDQGFLPDSGELSWLEWPQKAPSVRIDSGVRQGDVVSSRFDSMLAKLIVWGEDRAQAIARLQAALAHSHVLGVYSNIGFCRELVSTDTFLQGRYDTGWIDRYLQQRKIAELPPQALIAAAIIHYEHLQIESAQTVQTASPWNTLDGWRLNLPASLAMSFRHQQCEYLLQLLPRDPLVEIMLDNRRYACRWHWQGRVLWLEIDGQSEPVRAVWQPPFFHLEVQGRACKLQWQDPRQPQTQQNDAASSLAAPMPGVVIEVAVAVGDAVQAGDVLVVMEAMKMEHSIIAPADGYVVSVPFQTGDKVQQGDQLITLEARESES